MRLSPPRYAWISVCSQVVALTPDPWKGVEETFWGFWIGIVIGVVLVVLIATGVL